MQMCLAKAILEYFIEKLTKYEFFIQIFRKFIWID